MHDRLVTSNLVCCFDTLQLEAECSNELSKSVNLTQTPRLCVMYLDMSRSPVTRSHTLGQLFMTMSHTY